MEPDHYPPPEACREHVGSEGVAEDTDDIEVQDAPPALALENTPEVVYPVGTELKRLFEKE